MSSTAVPITDAGPIPMCGSLPAPAYDYTRQSQLCENDRQKGAVFGGPSRTQELAMPNRIDH
jgi:hypothetical protein